MSISLLSFYILEQGRKSNIFPDIRIRIRFDRLGIASEYRCQVEPAQFTPAWLMRLKSAPARHRAGNAGQRRHPGSRKGCNRHFRAKSLLEAQPFGASVYAALTPDQKGTASGLPAIAGMQQAISAAVL